MNAAYRLLIPAATLHGKTSMDQLIGKFSTFMIRNKHTLPDLSYDYGELEPVLSAEIMKIHHQKHHAAYVNNLNIAEEKVQESLAKGDVKSAIIHAAAMRFHGGGHVNHSIFWTMLAKHGGEPDKDLMEIIKKDFGSLESMQDKVNAAAVAVQGSGWGWLAYDKVMNRLQVAVTMNQDVLESTTGLIPLFGIDVWEHAYYLQYKNVRADYVKEIWKIANWKNINERYQKAIQK
ncbi:unnamed protein product [Dracunculus medinensis]|uniref:Superoxide dismutase n=1 Tax=Dracunculus medinensis TaxID=318479 RepID=A0A0N4UAL0_DRAME|nr:unnamed protein product [Dracunculus medinensis]